MTTMDKELEAIKERIKAYKDLGVNANRPETVYADISYLLNRLEAAEKAAKSAYRLGRRETFNDVIENMEMYLAELKKSREYLMKEEQKNG